MLFKDFKKNILKFKKAPLGGVNAQLKLAPAYRKQFDLKEIAVLNPTQAAVLILFFPDKNNETSFILIKRPDYKGHHANQISFPGGKKEDFDTNLMNTAIRETHEEIGIKVSKQMIFKQLTDVYIPPSNFLVQAYLAIADKQLSFIMNHEVKEILTVSVSEFLLPENIKIKSVFTSKDKKVKTPCYVFNEEIIWGATAMMLSEVNEMFVRVFSK